jgi:hypothetical protein
MTTIVKVFDNHQKKLHNFNYFVDVNKATISTIKYKTCTITLQTGAIIIYSAVDIKDYDTVLRNFSGIEVDWLDLDMNSNFSNEAVQFMKSRVRTSHVSSMCKHFHG